MPEDYDAPDLAPGPEEQAIAADRLSFTLERLSLLPDNDRAALLMRAAPVVAADVTGGGGGDVARVRAASRDGLIASKSPYCYDSAVSRELGAIQGSSTARR